jgi:hypothetical protein
LLNNYTDGNKTGLSIGFVSLDNCAIKDNIILDGESVMAAFTGNTKYNDFVVVQPDAPEIDGIAVISDMYTEGKKIMPDGSVADEASCYATLDYVDVSELPDSFDFYYGTHNQGTMGWALRIAQYDADKNSLSTNFSQIGFDTISANTSIRITKLSGCQYIRLFASAHPLPGVLTGDNVTPDPTSQIIVIPYGSVTNGKKLMPDGSLVEDDGLATVEYIDVSALSDSFILRYPDATYFNPTIRIAQYDINKNSLSDSFGLNTATETINGYKIWNITKLEGCQYIRIFLSSFHIEADGELCSVDGSGE